MAAVACIVGLSANHGASIGIFRLRGQFWKVIMCKFDQAWFSAGLSFACNQCGKCCHTSRQQEVFLNLAERKAAAKHLSVTVAAFSDLYLNPK